MARQLAPLAWVDIRGLNSADPPTRLPDTVATDAHNVLLERQSLGRRRPSMAAITPAANLTAPIYQLMRYQPAATAGTAAVELWVFQDSGTTICRYINGAATTDVSYGDAPSPALPAGGLAGTSYRPYGATFNGKLFVAYSTAVNRLHVWDGSSFRRAGIIASAAATVANTGAGAYAATIRYYKIQWKIISGSNTVATSELSASVTFTPSGGGTAARVTKPTTPDSATHWIVFGSSDNVTYYDISGDVAVGTTTYDDSVAPASYSDGTIAPTAGLYVPPPAAKYLLAANNRLFMAGAHGSVASGTTVPQNSRVWFTQVLGTLDNTGEDEAIAQTTAYKDWVSCGENDGDTIVGLGGPLDGAIYVFKQRSIWRLSPTGNINTPYRADQVSPSIGASWQDAITMGEDGQGNPALYFMSLTGPKRVVNGYGIEDIGADVRSTTATSYSSVFSTPVVRWDSVRRVIWWLTTSAQTAYAFQPQFEARTQDGGVRGGWTRHTIAIDSSATNNQCCVMYEWSSNLFVPIIGGAGPTSTEALASMSANARQDVAAVTIASSVTSPIFQPGGLLQRVSFGHPVLEWDYAGANSNAHAVSISSAIGGPLAVIGTVTDTATDASYTTAVVQEKLESLQLSDVFGLQATVTWDTSHDGDERPRIHGLTIPVTAQEGA